MTQKQSNKILGWKVCFVPTKDGKLFAGLKNEIIEIFELQDDANNFCANVNQGGYLDDLHIGYRVYPMYYIPKGIILR